MNPVNSFVQKHQKLLDLLPGEVYALTEETAAAPA